MNDPRVIDLSSALEDKYKTDDGWVNSPEYVAAQGVYSDVFGSSVTPALGAEGAVKQVGTRCREAIEVLPD